MSNPFIKVKVEPLHAKAQRGELKISIEIHDHWVCALCKSFNAPDDADCEACSVNREAGIRQAVERLVEEMFNRNETE